MADSGIFILDVGCLATGGMGGGGGATGRGGGGGTGRAAVGGGATGRGGGIGGATGRGGGGGTGRAAVGGASGRCGGGGATGLGGAMGCWSGGEACGALCGSDVPQYPQNLLPRGNDLWHFGHITWAAAGATGGREAGEGDIAAACGPGYCGFPQRAQFAAEAGFMLPQDGHLW